MEIEVGLQALTEDYCLPQDISTFARGPGVPANR